MSNILITFTYHLLGFTARYHFWLFFCTLANGSGRTHASVGMGNDVKKILAIISCDILPCFTYIASGGGRGRGVRGVEFSLGIGALVRWVA
jgi:hypothetical protein